MALRVSAMGKEACRHRDYTRRWFCSVSLGYTEGMRGQNCLGYERHRAKTAPCGRCETSHLRKTITPTPALASLFGAISRGIVGFLSDVYAA